MFLRLLYVATFDPGFDDDADKKKTKKCAPKYALMRLKHIALMSYITDCGWSDFVTHYRDATSVRFTVRRKSYVACAPCCGLSCDLQFPDAYFQ